MIGEKRSKIIISEILTVIAITGFLSVCMQIRQKEYLPKSVSTDAMEKEQESNQNRMQEIAALISD